MKRIITIIAAAVFALALSSCNAKIENPTARNFIGTWDLVSMDIIGTNGTVTSSQAKTLDYLVFTEDTISFYESDELSRQAKFAVKDNVIYVGGTAAYDIDEFSRKEMTLSQDGFGLLVSSYKYHYKKR